MECVRAPYLFVFGAYHVHDGNLTSLLLDINEEF